MAAAASAMARGDYDRRVRATSRDEVGELARAFNAMAADLADVERMRRDLVANVSHELRTPIGALQALLENLADGVEPTRPRRAADRAGADGAPRPARRAAAGPLAAGERRAARSSRSSFGVRELLEQATRECELGDRPVRLKVCVQPGDLRATGDPERMHQVVANLLDNAVRHSPPDGRVWLSAHADGGPDADRGRRRGARDRPARGRAGVRALLPRRRGPQRRRAAASAWRSRAGSSTPTAARSAPRARDAAAAAAWSWSCRREHAARGCRPRGRRIAPGRAVAGGALPRRGLGRARLVRGRRARARRLRRGGARRRARPGARARACSARALCALRRVDRARLADRRDARAYAPCCGCSRARWRLMPAVRAAAWVWLPCLIGAAMLARSPRPAGAAGGRWSPG